MTPDTFTRLCHVRDLLAAVREPSPSIRDLAREAHMSPYHFIRQFEAVFGVTPHQFRIRSRLDLAKLLLAGGNHSVTEVCLETGFSSLGSFSDLFTRRIGTAPSVWTRTAAWSIPPTDAGSRAGWRRPWADRPS